uniref:Chemokine interleukin-8-like domain-containing protein n=1 Tax=Myotis myotis TaxID=51298 RepID=A0A7J7SCM8_MYOMY|nr:hypothetical protein mMyoMyo1_009538 [Myotis myotis]
MAVHPLSWLLRLAVLCHLALLLAGQQHSVGKCRDMCNAMAMTREIPLRLLKSYRPTEASCRTPAIILTTKGNRTFCADPKEDWVQKAMQHLNRTASPFHERQVDPKTSPSTRGTDRSPASEPTATAESSSQGSRLSAPTSPAPDGGPSGGPERTELSGVAAATIATVTATTTTATSWQSSYQPTVDLGTEGKAFEAASTQTPSTQAPSTQALPTDTPSTQTPSTQALHTDTPSTQTPSTQAPSTQALPTDTPSTQAPSTQAPWPSMTCWRQRGWLRNSPQCPPSRRTLLLLAA